MCFCGSCLCCVVGEFWWFVVELWGCLFVSLWVWVVAGCVCVCCALLCVGGVALGVTLLFVCVVWSVCRVSRALPGLLSCVALCSWCVCDRADAGCWFAVRSVL